MTESTFDQPAPAMAAAQRQNTIARRVRTVTKLRIHLLLIVGGFAVLIPFFWMVSSSLKPDWEIFQIPPAWNPEGPLWQNYAIVPTPKVRTPVKVGAFWALSGIQAMLRHG